MSKFKEGDKVRVKKAGPDWTSVRVPTSGNEYGHSHRTGEWDGEQSWGVTDPACFYRYKESEMELIEGPVKVVTRKEVIPGSYGILRVGTVGASGARIPLAFDMEGDRFYGTSEITAAIEVLTAIRDALQEDAE